MPFAAYKGWQRWSLSAQERVRRPYLTGAYFGRRGHCQTGRSAAEAGGNVLGRPLPAEHVSVV